MNISYDKMIELRKILYGHKYAKNPYLDKEEYKEAMTRLENMKLPEVGSIKLPKNDIPKIQSEVIKFFTSNFKGLDFTVTTITEKAFKEAAAVTELANRNKDATPRFVIDTCLNAMKSKSKKSSIFSLPIRPKKNEVSLEGKIKKYLNILDDQKFLEELPILNGSIELGDRFDRISTGTYAHEVTHALLERHKGSIENYYNNEMLSIFMEKLVIDSYDRTPNKKILKASEVYRARGMQINIAKLFDKDINISGTAMQYLLGGFTAGVMFDKYQNESSQGKRRMLGKIKETLAGKKTVEQLIEEEQISLDNGALKKYLDKVEGYSKELENEQVR